MKNIAIFCLLAGITAGCRTQPTPRDRADTRMLQGFEVEVVSPAEHLGHNINEGGGHSVWCDGYRTRILLTGEPFVIYWMNKTTNDIPFRISQGKKCEVWYTGDTGKGVMDYEGRCINISQVVKVEDILHAAGKKSTRTPDDGYSLLPFDGASYFSEGLAAVKMGNKWGFIDRSGKMVINPQFDDEPLDFSEGLARVKVGEKLGYIDKSGTIAIKPQFDWACVFREGWAAVKMDGKYGYQGVGAYPAERCLA